MPTPQMRIFIPTMGRVDKQRTYDVLPNTVKLKYDAALVCPPGELAAHTSRNRTAVACKAKGIAAVRQWILEQAAPGQVVLMLDDDLNSWSARHEQPDGKAKYTKATAGELDKAFADFSKMMTKYAHGGINFRLFCQTKPPVFENSRLLRALAYNPAKFPKPGIKFRLPVMEDFDMQLQLMAAGAPCLNYNRIAQDQPGTGLPGGCATYRTAELQAKAAQQLAAKWPGVVTLVERTLKSSDWGGMGATRTDVRVDWAKAYKKGGK